MNKKVLSVLLLSALAINFTGINTNYSYANKVDELKEQKAQEEQNANEKRKNIEEMSAEKDGLFAKITLKKKQMTELEDKMLVLQEKIAELTNAIKESEDNIVILEERIKSNEELFKKRVRVMYGNKSLNSVEVLFASSNIRDFLSRFFLMQSMADHDKKLITSLKNDKIQLVKEKESLEANRATLIAENKNLEIERQSYQEEVARYDALIIKLEASIEYSESELKALEDKIKRLGDNISFEEKVKASALRKISENKLQEEIKTGYVPTNSGEMGWPLPNNHYISSYFGWRPSPMGNGTGMRHTGIDIPAPMGTPVYSATDGVVLRAGWDNTGYGNAVFIKYGNNITIIYGHNSQLVVSPGQTVSKGQVIAMVGSTGYSTGAHLHFEVRVNNSPVDPLPYLR